LRNLFFIKKKATPFYWNGSQSVWDLFFTYN